jgi:hypothetical protein
MLNAHDDTAAPCLTRGGPGHACRAYGLARILVLPSSDDYRHRLAFDEMVWRGKSAAGDDWPTRLRMVDSLMERRLLDGRTQSEVVGLLGPADETPKWRDWDLVYHLGPDRDQLPHSRGLTSRADKA